MQRIKIERMLAKIDLLIALSSNFFTSSTDQDFIKDVIDEKVRF